MNRAVFDRLESSRRWLLVPAGIFLLGAALTLVAIFMLEQTSKEIASRPRTYMTLGELLDNAPLLELVIKDDPELRDRLLADTEYVEEIRQNPELTRIFFPDEAAANKGMAVGEAKESQWGQAKNDNASEQSTAGPTADTVETAVSNEGNEAKNETNNE